MDDDAFRYKDWNFQGLWRMGTIGTIFCETAYPPLRPAMPRTKMMAKPALFRTFRTSPTQASAFSGGEIFFSNQ
jgi:hypothetical protein